MLMINTYVQTFKLGYNYKVKPKYQIISKLRQPIMQAVNIKLGNIKK